MRYVASHVHPAKQCPLQSAEGKTMLKNMFSKDSLKKSHIKLADAYVSCPVDTESEHKGFFIIDADNETDVKQFFGQMAVDIRQVSPFKEVEKKL